MTIRVSLLSAALLAWMAPPAAAATPVLAFEVTPAAGGRQLVRQSLPFPKGALAASDAIAVTDGRTAVPAALRMITAHPGAGPSSVRRGMVTFIWDFASTGPVRLEIHKRVAGGAPRSGAMPRVAPAAEGLDIQLTGGATVKARMIAPPPGTPSNPVLESVETNAFYEWRRYIWRGAAWPRVIEVRASALGEVVLVAHLQSTQPGYGYAPEFGWRLEIPREAEKQGYRIDHPTRSFDRRGSVSSLPTAAGRTYTYRRAAPGGKLPMQQYAWRRAALVIAPAGAAALTPTLEPPHTARSIGDYGTRCMRLARQSRPPVRFCATCYATIARRLCAAWLWATTGAISPDTATANPPAPCMA